MKRFLERENLSYDEMMEFIRVNLDNDYNFENWFELEYREHVGCEGSDVLFSTDCDGVEIEILGIISEIDGIESIKYNVNIAK